MRKRIILTGMVEGRKTTGTKFTRGSQALWQELEARGWSQRELGRALGAHVGEINRVLHGARVPRLELIAAANSLFGIPIEAWTTPARFVPPARKAKS